MPLYSRTAIPTTVVILAKLESQYRPFKTLVHLRTIRTNRQVHGKDKPLVTARRMQGGLYVFSITLRSKRDELVDLSDNGFDDHKNNRNIIDNAACVR